MEKWYIYLHDEWLIFLVKPCHVGKYTIHVPWIRQDGIVESGEFADFQGCWFTSFELVPLQGLYTTWKGSMAQLTCIGLSWRLTKRPFGSG